MRNRCRRRPGARQAHRCRTAGAGASRGIGMPDAQRRQDGSSELGVGPLRGAAAARLELQRRWAFMRDLHGRPRPGSRSGSVELVRRTGQRRMRGTGDWIAAIGRRVRRRLAADGFPCESRCLLAGEIGFGGLALPTLIDQGFRPSHRRRDGDGSYGQPRCWDAQTVHEPTMARHSDNTSAKAMSGAGSPVSPHRRLNSRQLLVGAVHRIAAAVQVLSAPRLAGRLPGTPHRPRGPLLRQFHDARSRGADRSPR